MNETLLAWIKERLLSRKFQAMVVGLILVVASKRGFILDPAMTNDIVWIISSYLVGQGIADHGKAAALIQAANPKPPDQVNIQSVTTTPDQQDTPTATTTTTTDSRGVSRFPQPTKRSQP